MTTFEYQAREQSGETRSGALDASSQDNALESLHQSGLIVISIRERARPFMEQLRLSGHVKQKDLVIFSRQLATLFEAQIPVVQALKTLVAETSKAALQTVVQHVLDDITGGLSLSQAMMKHPKAFSPFYVNLVRSGEESGKLQDVFTYLADYLERSYYITTKARNAMIYPAFILVAFMGVLIVMLVFVIPRLASIFAETGQQLPFYTQAILSTSLFLQKWGFIVAILAVIGGIFGWRWSKTNEGTQILHRAQISTPVIGTLYRKLFMARLTDNLKTLIMGGIPILRALAITGDVVGNVIYKKALEDAIESVKGGNTISAAFERTPEIPALVTQMIRIGETSGRLDYILGSVAKFYQREVDSAVDNLVSLIEPILILFLGGGVALLVGSIMVPLYNMVGSF